MKSKNFRLQLEKILSEPIESTLKREENTLENLIGGLDNSFLLFGAGHLGRKTLKTLKNIGKVPLAFIDNNPALWGTQINGAEVISPKEASTRYDPSTVGIITTIWCGEATDKMSDRIKPLQDLGFQKIALFGHLAWKFQDEFLPHYCLDLPTKIIQAKDQVINAFDLLSDDKSRELYVNHIQWRLFLDYDLLPPPSSYEIYFDNHFSGAFNSEVLYDIGAFTGDSIEGFLKTSRGKGYSEIHSFEPSPNNFNILKEYIESLPNPENRIFAHQLALGDVIGSIQVESEYGPASRVGLGDIDVPVSTIDEFSKTHQPPTFIKIDIEGFEPNCLLGAKNTISQTAPVVAVCVYHLQSHIWEILLQLNSYYPNYHFSLCPHLADGWDLVLYAVPTHRLPN